MKLHILTDNRTQRPEMLTEHGLSVYIEAGGLRVLFDTGQTDVYLRNAERMGLSLHPDCVVISHGHYDHGGGLAYYPAAHMPEVYVQPDGLRNKYAADKDDYHAAGQPWAQADVPAIRSRLVYNDRDMAIAPGVALHARIPIGAFEDGPHGFFVEADGVMELDDMHDEQMLVFERGKGLVIFLGCSHLGIVNCLLHVRALYPGRRIDTVLAGMHLHSAASQYIADTIAQLRGFDIARLIPLHCTGEDAISAMKQAFGECCLLLGAGDSIEI